MKTFLTVLLIVHIISGFTALLTGGIAAMAAKGGRAHRTAGKWYFWGMTGVFITATLLGIFKERIFLFMIGFFSYYLVARGYRVLYMKALGRTQTAKPLDWFISGTAFLFGAALVVWAVREFRAGRGFWPVPLVFGIIAIALSLADARLYTKGPKDKRHWLAGHITSMSAGYIATWTAFVVTNNRFLPNVVAWLLPTVIGSILIAYSIRKYAPKKPRAQTGLVAVVLLLLSSASLEAQTLHSRLSVAGIGSRLYAQLLVQKSDTAFSLRQRLLPGAAQPLFYTEGATVNGTTVKGTAVVFGAYRYQFAGYANTDSVRLVLMDTAGKTVGELKGSSMVPAIRPSYGTVAQQIVDTMKRYLFNKAYLDSAGFKNFAATLKQYGFFLQDDLEFVGAVNREMRKLPFSHCRFTTSSYTDFVGMVNSQFSGTRPVEYKPLNASTAYLKITSFDGDGSNMAAAMERLIAEKRKTLVIDLRGNYGGGAGAALQLAKYLIPTSKPAGALVTNQWFDTAARPPVAADYGRFYTFRNGTTLDLIEAMKTAAGVVLAVSPAAKQFKGNVFILTDGRTASTCEPFVYAAKQSGRATVVGKRTAGAMLSAGGFWLNTGYLLSLPVADYFTNDGVRLDKRGVEPNVVVEGDALEAVLQRIPSF